MADEKMQAVLDKRVTICPLSFMLGYIQNYRVTERKNMNCLESRPVKGTDAFSDDFFKVLHAPRGSDVEVTHSSGKTITLKGLGQPDAQALKFNMKSGLAARQAAVPAVNKGELRAPKKNWDKTFGPEQKFTYIDPSTKEELTFHIGGGRQIDDLKKDFPDLYNVQRRTKTSSENEDVLDDDVLETALMPSSTETSQINDDDLEGLVSDIGDPEDEDDEDEDEDDEERMVGKEEQDPTFAAIEVAEPPSNEVMDDFGISDTTQQGQSAAQANQEGNLQGAAQLRHEKKEMTGSGRVEQFDAPKEKRPQHATEIQITAPSSATAVAGQAMKYMTDDMEHTAYKIQDPHCGNTTWVEEGANHCRICGNEVVVNVR